MHSLGVGILKRAIEVLCVVLLPTVAAAETQVLRSGIPAQEIEPKARQTPVVGACEPTRIRYIATNSTDQQTKSTEYVHVPQGSVQFEQHADGCVIVHFAGVVLARTFFDEPQRIVIRAILEDTNMVAVPRNVQLSGDDDEEGDGRWARAHSMFFVFPNVPAGTHRMTLQWKSPEGGLVFMHQHTVLVHHE